MKPVKIYCLKNPIDGLIFYVGATMLPKLHSRLSYHLTEVRQGYNILNGKDTGHVFGVKKRQIIKSILDVGLKPEIILLEEVEFGLADFKERFYYNLFTRAGFELYQKNSFTGYCKKELTIQSKKRSKP